VFANANLLGVANPTGTVTFKLFSPEDTSCSAPIFTSQVPVNSTSVNSAHFLTSRVGTYRWTATYSGDANLAPAGPTPCSDPACQVIVDKALTFVTVTATAPASGALRATATLSGGFNPTGAITFLLAPPGDTFCSSPPVFTTTVPVNGNGAYESAPFVPIIAGSYKWRARYDGDANNLGAGPTACIDSAAAVTIATAQLEANLPGQFHALSPVRILDTRGTEGRISGPIGPGAGPDVQITGRFGVPASGVAAVVMNATVTAPAAAGHLIVFPAGEPQPLAASLTYGPGQTVSNLVVAKLGAGGRLSVSTASRLSLILDLQGWFSA
jgi:hypothetical protein